MWPGAYDTVPLDRKLFRNEPPPPAEVGYTCTHALEGAESEFWGGPESSRPLIYLCGRCRPWHERYVEDLIPPEVWAEKTDIVVVFWPNIASAVNMGLLRR